MRSPSIAPPSPTAGRAGFDYAVLPVSAQKVVREQTETIHGLLGKTAVNVVQIGLRLQLVRNRLGREHFRPWLDAEFAWGQPTASNYMRAARAFGEVECLDRFQSTAMFILAREKTPASARAEAVRLARRGERVTKARALELVDRHAPAAGSTEAHAARLRRLLLKAAPKLSPHDVRRLAQELWDLAAKMP